MSTSDNVPFFSRFAVKFIEILAAGLATTVSGYLIAYVAGAVSSSTPVAVGTATQVAPSAGGVSSASSAKPPAPASAGANEQHQAPVPDANVPSEGQPPRGAERSHEPSYGDASKAAVAPKRPETDKHLEPDKHLEADKHLETDTSAAAGAAEGKGDQEENKHAQDAVLARIRAALANSDAKRTNLPDTPQRAGNGARPTATIRSQSTPVDKRPSTAPAPVTLASPNSANPPPPSQLQVQPPVQQLVQHPVQQQVQPTIQQQPPTEPAPLTTVEIPSRPVATVQTAPVPAPNSQDDSGMFSGLDRLRHDPLAASDDAPRPPMPVGQ
jgi:hypothetical protein